ncbi:MAG: UDP-N-acetylmuramate dehydrogenase [bacterium]
MGVSRFLYIEIQKDVKLSEYTTFKIGGKAKYFFIAKKREDIFESISWAKNNEEKFFILGGGSNALFSDEGFEGLVIKLDFKNVDVKKNIILADAGVKISALIEIFRKNSFEGLEWASGIPGITLGGAIRGNAGAFGKSISDLVRWVEAVNTKTLGRVSENLFENYDKLSKKECDFRYRTSLFKERNDYAILSAGLEMKKGDRKIIEEKIKNIAQIRNEKQPLGYPNAGSIFKNAVYAKEYCTRDFPNEFIKTGVIPAGWLIERCGLKGEKKGDAMISVQHANIIVNLGKAKAKDVLGLIELAEKEVKKKFGIELEKEIEAVSY